MLKVRENLFSIPEQTAFKSLTGKCVRITLKARMKKFLLQELIFN